jgi:phosphoribosylaminoimidazole-succinocarboxamide synthase
MGVDIRLLQEQCQRTLGYVRGDLRTIVCSDRISCFDVIVGTIPFKGQVLNQLAAFWFEKTRGLARNHLLEVPDPNVSVVQECLLLPVEFVYRAYLTGSTNTSILHAYSSGAREYCGHRLPDGLRPHQLLPQPLLTPTTKAAHGEHDQLASRAELLASGAISAQHFDRAAEICARLFAAGRRWADERGLILVDTKYEMGLAPDGEIVVIDEIHTPDSSRYWYKQGYEQAMSEGKSPAALDKEYVRRWLVDRGYRGDGTPPALPDEVRCEAARRYIEAFEQVTGRAFEPSTDAPLARIRRNLRLD